MTKTVLASCLPANGMINTGGSSSLLGDVDKTLASTRKEWSQRERLVSPHRPASTLGQVRLNWTPSANGPESKAEIRLKPKEGAASRFIFGSTLIWSTLFPFKTGARMIGTERRRSA